MQKKIKRFQRLAKVRKKDVSKEINNSNLVQNEIIKNESLIDQINTIMESSKNNSSNGIINLITARLSKKIHQKRVFKTNNKKQITPFSKLIVGVKGP